MEKIIEKIPNERIQRYDLIQRFFGDKKVCMFDIETTGLSPLKSFTYIIGVNVFEDGEWKIIQLFNDDGRSEPEMIRAFQTIIKGYDILFEFNGDTFDIPYIEKRMNIIESKFSISLTNHFNDIESFDLLKFIRPYKMSLGLPNLKQKTLERYIGLNRVDMYNGGQLIDVYLGYLASGDSKARGLVLRHNRDDMEGMVFVSSLLAEGLLSRGDFEVTGINTNVKKNSSTLHLEISIATEYEVVRPVCSMMDRNNFEFDGKNGTLYVPIEEGTLNYYYGQKESDGHESVSGFFVAAASGDIQGVPLYKEKARDKISYIMLDDTFLGNAGFLKLYAERMIYDIMHFRGRK